MNIKEQIDNVTGQRFGKLIVNRPQLVRTRYKSGTIKPLKYVCLCDCGKSSSVTYDNLVTGNSRSCGCGMLESRVTHGMTKTSEFMAWCGMRSRCMDTNNKKYPRYGGRGILVCARWLDSFEAFYNDIGPRPSDKHSIDRIDNDGNYEPGNCRWATSFQQSRNRSGLHRVKFQGKTMSVSEWAERTGIRRSVLYNRFRNGWSARRALTEHVHEECVNIKVQQ